MCFLLEFSKTKKTPNEISSRFHVVSQLVLFSRPHCVLCIYTYIYMIVVRNPLAETLVQTSQQCSKTLNFVIYRNICVIYRNISWPLKQLRWLLPFCLFPNELLRIMIWCGSMSQRHTPGTGGEGSEKDPLRIDFEAVLLRNICVIYRNIFGHFG